VNDIWRKKKTFGEKKLFSKTKKKFIIGEIFQKKKLNPKIRVSNNVP